MQTLLVDHRVSRCLGFDIEGIKYEPNCLDLNLEITFNRQTIHSNNCSFDFGIERGHLKLNLKDCFIPSQSCQITTEQLITFDKSDTELKVSIYGQKSNRGWYFEKHSKISQAAHLSGSLFLTKWAKLYIKKRPCFITAIFSVSATDITLFNQQSMNLHQNNTNNLIVAKAYILRKLCQNEEQEYDLSRVEYECI